MSDNTRVIICGGRDFSDRDLLFRSLDKILQGYSEPEIVSGHAKGADLLGEEYAALRGFKVSIFQPDWNKHGRAAGPIRNRQMLQYALHGAPVVVAFWDGISRGTKNMIEQAKNAGAMAHIIPY